MPFILMWRRNSNFEFRQLNSFEKQSKHPDIKVAISLNNVSDILTNSLI